jgi:hypothetical protein
VNSDKGRGAKATKVFSRVQSGNGALNPAQRQEYGADGLELGIGETVLRRWVSQAELEAGRGLEGELKRSEREELVELRRENRRLRMERES